MKYRIYAMYEEDGAIMLTDAVYGTNIEEVMREVRCLLESDKYKKANVRFSIETIE